MPERSQSRTGRVSRRALLTGGVAVAAGAALVAARPGDRGKGGHDSYFAGVAAALAQAGIATPRLVIDLERLDANTKRITGNIGGAMDLRLVAKSLPSFELLDHIASITGTDRWMTFNLPFLRLTAEQRPGVEQLLGKPMPVTAAAEFFRAAKAPEHALGSVQWLVDTPRRARQYAELAEGLGRSLRVNVELDVGLHRGGVETRHRLAEILSVLNSSDRLEWSGLMGYDAHLGAIPDLFGSRAREIERSKSIYDSLHAAALEIMGAQAGLTLNTAGSPTYRLHDGKRAPNEVAIGSAFVKPMDFDTSSLADLQPASFIATPVLKAEGPFRMTGGTEAVAAVRRLWDPNARRAFFIYGGHWLAEPVSPPGLQVDPIYGQSSNQQLLTGSPSVSLDVDDMVFFRPTQSEAVLTRFGNLLVYDRGRIVDQWPVFPARP